MARSKKRKDQSAEAAGSSAAAAREERLPFGLSVKARRALVVLLYVLGTLACLSVPTYEYIFPEDKTPRLIGPDAYFHLRQVKAVLEDYPRVVRHDMRTNFPNGESGLNQGFFDVTAASVTKFSGGLISPELTLAWVSPLCWLAVGLIGYWWILRRANELCASLFLLFMLLYPGPLKAIAAMGHGDHHAAEILLALLVALGLDWLLQPKTSEKMAPIAMLPLFYFYLSWAGTPLHLLIVGAVFYVRAWMPQGDNDDPKLAQKGAFYGLSLLLAVLATKFLVPWAVIWSTSEQIFLLASAALGLGYAPLVWLAKRTTKFRALTAVGVLGGALLFLYLTPTGHSAINEMFSPRTRQIAEHTPVSGALLLSWFGLLWLLALGGPLVMLWKRAFWPNMVPILYGGSLVFFWVQTYDFNYYTPPMLAFSAAYALGSLPWSAASVAVLVVMLIVPFFPGSEHPWLSRKTAREIILHTDGLEAASQWLKQVQGPRRPDAEREYGLLAPWDLGNILAETSETPVAYSQTASGELARRVYSDEPDKIYEELVGGSKPLRYILLPARNLGEKFLGEMGAANLTINDMYRAGAQVEAKGKKIKLLEPSTRNRKALISRLYWDEGQELGHYRMVFESSEQVLQVTRLLDGGRIEFYAWPVTPKSLLDLQPLLTDPAKVQETSRGTVVGARQAPEVRIFETVPGALLEGSAPANSTVKARLNLYAPTSKRSWTVAWQTRADSSGKFSLRVPYSTGAPLNDNPQTIQVRGEYELKLGDRKINLGVSESDVQKSAVIAVPKA